MEPNQCNFSISKDVDFKRETMKEEEYSEEYVAVVSITSKYALYNAAQKK